MRKSLGYLFTLAVPLAMAGLAVAWMLDLGLRPRSGLVFDTAQVSRGSIQKVVTTSGPVRALVTVSVGSQLSGQIEGVNVDFNREVKPGDILATVDRKTFQAKVAQAQADLAAARAGLSTQEAALLKSKSVLKLAELTTDRQKSLAAKGFAAQSQLDAAMRDVEVGRADIIVSEAQIASAKATIQQRQAALDQAQIDLERTEIRSPIEGTVISRTVDPGQTVAASLQAPELFKIAQDLSRVRVEAQVNEADVGMIAEGNTAMFSVDAYPDRQFEGRVTQVRLAATELNNVVTYTVIVEADNGGRKLFPGMTANVVITSATRDGVLRVPNDVFRYKPRKDTAGARRRDGGARLDHMVEFLKKHIALTPPQEGAVRQAMGALGEEMRDASQRGAFGAGRTDRKADGQRAFARIEQALRPLLNDEQRPAFEKWKQEREQTKQAMVWVLGPDGQPERRSVRIGIADDQFTEIVGGNLDDGEKVVVRAREART